MGYKIDEIEGIGPTYKTKLSAADIRTTDDLLERCGRPEGRKAVAEKAGLSEKHLLDWANMADLMRVTGVGPQFAELLGASGVDTVKELQHRNADNLAEKLNDINTQKNLAKTSPPKSTVQGWIDQAKTLKPTIEH